MPAGDLADPERCHLAGSQRAPRKVPQRAFAPVRLVDRVRLRAVTPQARQEGVVGGVREQPENLHLALLENGGICGSRQGR
jgi:hypothetical protein